MRIFVAVTVLLVAGTVYAQDDSVEPAVESLQPTLLSNESAPFGVPIDDFGSEEVPPVIEPRKSDKQEEAAPAKDFKLRVFLNEPLGTHAALQTRTVQAVVARPFVETRLVDGRQIQVTRSVSEVVNKTIQSVTDGATVIECDSMNIEVNTVDNTKVAYEFTIDGQLKLLNGSSELKADYAKFGNGKLTLSNVVGKTAGIKMKSAEVVIEMDVNSLRIGDYVPGKGPYSLLPIPFDGTPQTQPEPNYPSADNFSPSRGNEPFIPFGEAPVRQAPDQPPATIPNQSIPSI